MRLSDALMAVISQRLVPTADGQGRIAACEIMTVTGTIRDCILDPDRTQEISDLIAEGRSQYGSQTFDQHLMEMVNKKVVEFEVAKANANNPNDFDLNMRGFGSSAPSAQAGGADEAGMGMFGG